MTLPIKEATDKLVVLIREYESDTFSAEDSKITLGESQLIAAKLIDRIEDHLDGVTISAILDEIR